VLPAVLLAVLLAVPLAGCANSAVPAPPRATPSAAASPTPSAPTSAAPSATGRPSASPAPSSAEVPAPNGVTTPAQVFGSGCAALPTGTAPGSPTASAGLPVVAALAAVPSLSSLSTALKKADLTGALDAQHGVTVFAPTDQAFAELRQTLGQQAFDELLADQNQLADLLKYQVVAQRYDRAGLLAAGSGQTVPTLEGTGVQVAGGPDGRTPRITDGAGRVATVLCGNIPTANATVFVVDRVLLRRTP
jgi:uncharacterized surface protein with fasciclin (FAS1) repeats